jgi:hypothetical protein
MIIKEYICMAHGDFEGGDAVCPSGCSGDGMVQRVFRTPVAIRSAQFGNINNTIQTLANDYGLSDIDTHGGDGIRRADWRVHKRLNQGKDMSQYFQPLHANGQTPSFGPSSGFTKTESRVVDAGNGMQRTIGTGKTVLGNGITLNTPTAKVMGSFDGKGLGIPQGDA